MSLRGGCSLRSPGFRKLWGRLKGVCWPSDLHACTALRRSGKIGAIKGECMAWGMLSLGQRHFGRILGSLAKAVHTHQAKKHFALRADFLAYQPWLELACSGLKASKK